MNITDTFLIIMTTVFIVSFASYWIDWFSGRDHQIRLIRDQIAKRKAEK